MGYRCTHVQTRAHTVCACVTQHDVYVCTYAPIYPRNSICACKYHVTLCSTANSGLGMCAPTPQHRVLSLFVGWLCVPRIPYETRYLAVIWAYMLNTLFKGRNREYPYKPHIPCYTGYCTDAQLFGGWSTNHRCIDGWSIGHQPVAQTITRRLHMFALLVHAAHVHNVYTMCYVPCVRVCYVV